MIKYLILIAAMLGVIAPSLTGCAKPRPTKSEIIKTQPQAIQSPLAKVTKGNEIYNYLYALNGIRYSQLAHSHAAKIMVVDVDDSRLTSTQVNELKKTGKTVFSYLSIGEAENYRTYWQSNWRRNNPDFILDENKNWRGNFRVKFWDKNWQNIIISKAKIIAQMGFNGVYLDIIDGYQQPSVIAAYPSNKQQLRQEMENFVIRISNATKQINPSFKIIPQNAVELIGLENNKNAPNLNYLRAIDGMGVEDLWFDDDKIADWTKWDLRLIRIAQQHGKFILATSYPTNPGNQATFLNNALKEKLIPFVGKRELSKQVPAINKQLLQK